MSSSGDCLPFNLISGRSILTNRDGAPFLLPTDNSVLRRQLDRWFNDLNVVPVVAGEFADSAMLKIAGRSGLGLFAIPEIIEEDVRKLYGLTRVGLAAGIEEQFHAVSVVRRVNHPGVQAMIRSR